MSPSKPTQTNAIENFDDKALVAKALAGNHHAYNKLVERYTSKIRRLALSILHNEAEADDAVQDVFLSLLNTLEKWDPNGPAKFSTWIYRISFNKCIDIKRKRKPSTPSDDLEILSTENDGYKNTLRKEMAEKLSDLLKTLPTAQHQALSYYYYRELSVKEISSRMDKTEQSIRSLLKRGKATLRERIDERSF